MANRQPAIPAPPMQRSLFLASVKLAQQVGADPATSGTRIVSTTIRQSNPQGEPLSVGEWSRQTIVQNADWLVKIAKRDKDISKNGSGVVRITFGNGYDALVAIDCEEFPQEISEMNRVGVVVCVSTVDDDDDSTRLKYRGVVNPSDSIFEHLQACVEGGRHEQDIRIYIHTDVNPWTTLDESIERTEIYRVKTNRNDPFSMGRMEHMVPLEEQLRATGKAGTLEGETKPAAKNASLKKTAATAKTTHGTPGEDSQHGFEFNPKEYILLSKAFNGKLSKYDSTVNESKFTDKEVKKAERICKAARTALTKDSIVVKKVASKGSAKAALKPSTTTEKTASKEPEKAEATKKTTPKKKPTPKDSEKPKIPAKETKQIETPKEKASEKKQATNGIDEPKSPTKKASKSPTKETKQVETPKRNTPRKKQATAGTETKSPTKKAPKSPTKETQKVDAPKSPTKETQKVETPKRKKRTTRSSPAENAALKEKDGAETETDAAETPKKKQKSKHKLKDAIPSAAETEGPEGTIKKAAPEGKEQVETPVKRKSRKRKSTTLEEVPAENVATDTPTRRQGRPKGSTNKPKEPGQKDGATPKK